MLKYRNLSTSYEQEPHLLYSPVTNCFYTGHATLALRKKGSRKKIVGHHLEEHALTQNSTIAKEDEVILHATPSTVLPLIHCLLLCGNRSIWFASTGGSSR